MKSYKPYTLLAGVVFWGLGATAQTNAPPMPQDPNQVTPQAGQQQPGMNYPGTQTTNPDQQPQATPPQSASQAVTEVQNAFQKDPTLSQTGVSAYAGENNNLVLSGTVQNQDQKDRAEQVARAASGGMSIDNKIQVSSGSTTPQNNTTPPPQ